jgi:hypothetical protein
MTPPNIPKQYKGSRETRERYTEGWQDARAGRPHAHVRHANAIIQQQGRRSYDAYSAGHADGRVAATSEPALIAQASALLDELEHMDLTLLPADQVAELVARLHRATEIFETHLQARRGSL